MPARRGRGFAVVASEVRKLAERSIRSTESIQEIIAAVQDETNATILATEQGAKQAREVGELMGSTVDVLDESIRATDQQKEAAEQVSVAMVEIRTAAEQLAAEQTERTATAERVDGLVEELERGLVELAAVGGNGSAAALGNGGEPGMSGLHVRVRVAGEDYALPMLRCSRSPRSVRSPPYRAPGRPSWESRTCVARCSPWSTSRTCFGLAALTRRAHRDGREWGPQRRPGGGLGERRRALPEASEETESRHLFGAARRRRPRRRDGRRLGARCASGAARA